MFLINNFNLTNLNPMLIGVVIAVVLMLVFGILTAIVARKKGRNAFGWFLLGLLTGPFALAIILIALPLHYYIKGGDDDL